MKRCYHSATTIHLSTLGNATTWLSRTETPIAMDRANYFEDFLSRNLKSSSWYVPLTGPQIILKPLLSLTVIQTLLKEEITWLLILFSEISTLGYLHMKDEAAPGRGKGCKVPVAWLGEIKRPCAPYLRATACVSFGFQRTTSFLRAVLSGTARSLPPLFLILSELEHSQPARLINIPPGALSFSKHMCGFLFHCWRRFTF